MDPGHESFDAHLQERELHAFADSAGAESAAPLVTVADDQDHFADWPRRHEADETHRRVMPVADHEEPAALVEQVGQHGQLHPVHDPLDEAGDVGRIAQMARHPLVFQPVHQGQRMRPGDLRAQRNERQFHRHPIGLAGGFGTRGCPQRLVREACVTRGPRRNRSPRRR